MTKTRLEFARKKKRKKHYRLRRASSEMVDPKRFYDKCKCAHNSVYHDKAIGKCALCSCGSYDQVAGKPFEEEISHE